MSYESLVAIVLSVLSISITILSVVIALAAAWGFRRIKQDAAHAAENAAKEKLCEFVGTQEWEGFLLEEIRRRLELEADRLFRDFAMVAAFSSPASGQEPEVAQPYPESEETHVDS